MSLKERDTSSLRDDGAAIHDDLRTFRQRMPQQPEIGLDLPRTQERVLTALDGLGYEISTGAGATSVTAVLRGGADRADAADAARHMQVLCDAGVVERVGRTRGGTGRTRWRVLLRGGAGVRYDVVPWSLVRAWQAGTVPAGVLTTWLHLDQALGARGWTRDLRADLARSPGQHTRTIARHVGSLGGARPAEVAGVGGRVAP